MSKRKESLVLLLNIGVTNPNIENNSSLFEKAKYIAQRKIEKMIFLKPKDEIAIMLMGSSITKNNLNSKYIEEFTDFQVPNWDFVRKCMNLKSTKYCYNWVEALYAAVEFIKQNVIDNSIRKIILMSDFNEETNIISKFEAKLIANKLFEEKIELITIAENLLHDKPLTSLNSSKKLLKDFHDQINGQHIIFDDAISCLKFYEQTSVKPLPSYYDLQLFDKKIPVVSYVKIDIEKFPTWKKAKGNQKLQSKIEYLDGQRNSYAKDEIIKGYKYGGTFIPVEKELEDKLSYKSEMKSYKIYGFTDKNNIDLEHFYKSATHVILPSSEESNVTKPFYSLVQAMHETNSVAIVRKVFRNNSTPRMVALFPCIDIPNEPWCLVEIELAFAEDQRLMESRPMKSIIKQLSNEQNKAVDNLINSLMLNDIQDSCEIDGNQYFLPGCVPNPAIQHRWHILSYRAINPDKPLPAMENYLKKILEAPLIKERKPAGSANPPQSQSTKRRCLAWINRCFCPCSTFISMGITYTCSVIALLAVLLVTTEAGDMMRKSIVFDKNTPDVFYCPQQKPTGFEKMLVTAKPLSRLCQFEGKPIPPDYKSDCYNDVDETEYACKEKYRIMKRFRNKAEGDENTMDDLVEK